MDYEKELEEILVNNAELREVFEKHPESKAMYLEKMKDADGANAGCRGINPVYCKTCMFSRGVPPFADAPEKAYCMIYERDKTSGKPPDVYYEGAECEYYEKQKD